MGFVTTKASRRATRIRRGAPHGNCHWCGRQFEYLTVDHVLPRALGGGNSSENKVRACIQCNALKGDMHPDEWKIVMRDIPEWWRLARMRGPFGSQLVKAMQECGFSFDPRSNGQPYEQWSVQ